MINNFLIPKIPTGSPSTRKFGTSHDFFLLLTTFPSSRFGTSRFLSPVAGVGITRYIPDVVQQHHHSSYPKASHFSRIRLACSAGVFFERAICSRKRHVETSRREEEMGRVKGSGEREEKMPFFLPSPSPSPLSFFRPGHLLPSHLL